MIIIKKNEEKRKDRQLNKKDKRLKWEINYLGLNWRKVQQKN